MRPLKLSVKGFTAFRDEQTIDFTDLELFVLTGPTGSGKSSLLDAITYSLFGEVERVGNQTGQLISQGQPRMAVTLDFKVGEGTYRVARTTSAKGQSKVLLERLEGKDWVSFGEGADSIREVNRIVTDLIGLDYDAFTRSVILPQGKFAEFLTGDAKQRREILTELLGLELFGRMAQRAGEISRNAKVGLETKQGVLDREYAGVDEAALETARKDLANVTKTLAGAEKNEARMSDIEKAWTAAQGRVSALSKCAKEAIDLSKRSSAASSELDALGGELKQAQAALSAAETAVADAKKAAAAAATTKTKAEKRLGDLGTLNQLWAKAESVAAFQEEVEEAAQDVEAAQKKLDQQITAEKKAAEQVASATASLAEASEAVALAEADHHAAHKSDLVATLTADLEPGDACPVCTRPLDDLPEADRKSLARAAEALEKARTAKELAARSLSDAQRDAALAEQAAKTSHESVTRCEKELGRKQKKAQQVEGDLRGVLGPKVTDPSSEIEKRIAEIEELTQAESISTAELATANDEVGRRRIALERRERQVSEILVRLRTLAFAGLVERVADADEGIELPGALPDDLPDDPGALAPIAASFAKDLAKLSDDLDATGSACRRQMADLLESARKLLPAEAERSPEDLQAMIAAARAETKQLVMDKAAADGLVKSLDERLKARAAYEKEIARDRAEFDLYNALGKELKSDRIVSFLQAEALRALAAAGGMHLRELSGTRYDLRFEDDRFYVIDEWNGNERRSVKTLSGGETFLASLALALALSEQVQHLAVTERERLESLFLDEGFGTLDPETLDAVVAGIEQLGRDGRLVGVITHVAELADVVPVRLRVTKSPRGSTISREVDGPG